MSIYDFEVKDGDGNTVSLSEYKGKVLLIVNSAIKCGFTPQYEGLEKLYENYHDKGLEVLDFPCNQFLNQAPGTDDEIHEFCTFRYKTQFDQFRKVDVNGENESPVYTWLKEQIKEEDVKGAKNKATMAMISKLSSTCKKDGDIKWNFTKFLVDRDGNAVKRYAPTTDPSDIEKDIIALL